MGGSRNPAAAGNRKTLKSPPSFKPVLEERINKGKLVMAGSSCGWNSGKSATVIKAQPGGKHR